MKREIFVLILILSLGVVSAHVAYWNMDGGALRQVPSEEGKVLSYEKIENLNRFSIETYRLGYTYRATDDFKKRYDVDKIVYLNPRREYPDWDDKDWDIDYHKFDRYDWDKKIYSYWEKKYWEMKKYYDWNKDYYYKWSVLSGSYDKIECYHSAPYGKLLYRKCP